MKKKPSFNRFSSLSRRAQNADEDTRCRLAQEYLYLAQQEGDRDLPAWAVEHVVWDQKPAEVADVLRGRTSALDHER